MIDWQIQFLQLNYSPFFPILKLAKIVSQLSISKLLLGLVTLNELKILLLNLTDSLILNTKVLMILLKTFNQSAIIKIFKSILKQSIPIKKGSNSRDCVSGSLRVFWWIFSLNLWHKFSCNSRIFQNLVFTSRFLFLFTLWWLNFYDVVVVSTQLTTYFRGVSSWPVVVEGFQSQERTTGVAVKTGAQHRLSLRRTKLLRTPPKFKKLRHLATTCVFWWKVARFVKRLFR